MKKRWWIALGIVVAGLGLAVLLVLLRPEPEQREREEPAPRVQTRAAARLAGPIEVTATGTVEPALAVQLAPLVPGRVIEVAPRFESGRRIGAGELLFRVDPADFENAVQQARAEVARREVEVMLAREERAIAEQELDRFRERVDALGLDEAPIEANPLLLREPQLRAAQAGLQRAKALLADARLALARTRVTMPFDGYVQATDLDEGDVVAVGQPVGQLIGADALEVRVPLSDDEAALIPALWAEDAARPTARVVLDYGGTRFAWDGRVERAEAVVDPQTRSIDAIVVVPDPFDSGRALDDEDSVAGLAAPPLLVGQFVEVRIAGAELDGVVAIPRRALRPGDRVWVLRDGRLAIVDARPVQTIGETSHVRAAIADGEAVIVSELRAPVADMRLRDSTEDVDGAEDGDG